MDGNTFAVGDRIGDYEVIQVLGAGGFGQVYKVKNSLSDRLEALKVLLPSHLGDAALTERFLREIKVQAAMQHPNIAALYGAQRQGDRILMFMEYIDGITLDKALEGGKLPFGVAASIVAQVLDALAYAHANGVIHRDIKPANIMIQSDGRVKLMDFGIARLGQDRKLTTTGQALGSLHYMSPEQINAVPDLDARSDLYSLGIVLYQSITGTKPFDGPSDFSIMAGHLNTPAAPPIAMDPSVPQAINDVVLHAVEKNRDLRFQTAQQFREALNLAMGGNYPPVLIPNFATDAANRPAASGSAASIPIPLTGSPTGSMTGPRATGPTAAMQYPPPPPVPIPQYSHQPPPPPQPYPPTPSQGYPAPQQYQQPPQQAGATGQSPVIYVNVAQNAQANQQGGPRGPALMDTLTQQALKSHLGAKNAPLAAVIGFVFPCAGAAYTGKGAMAFVFLCIEMALFLGSCMSGCVAAIRSSSSAGSGFLGGFSLETIFHIYGAWQCFKWATIRNLSLGLLPHQQQQPPPPPAQF